MALTAKQRAKLPASAFVKHDGPRSTWRGPVPTKLQAAKAGISETQRLRMHAATKGHAARTTTPLSKSTVQKVARRRR